MLLLCHFGRDLEIPLLKYKFKVRVREAIQNFKLFLQVQRTSGSKRYTTPLYQQSQKVVFKYGDEHIFEPDMTATISQFLSLECTNNTGNIVSTFNTISRHLQSHENRNE